MKNESNPEATNKAPQDEVIQDEVIQDEVIQDEVTSIESEVLPMHMYANRWKEAYADIYGVIPTECWNDISNTNREKIIRILNKWELADQENEIQASKAKQEYRGLTELSDHFEVLGYTDKKFWFLPYATRTPIGLNLNEVTSKGLLSILDLDSWVNAYPRYNAEGQLYSEPHWLKAGNELMMQCQKKGYYDEKRIRGKGFWLDGENIVFNTGENLLDAYSFYPASKDNLQYIYRSSSKIVITNEIATHAEILELFDVINKIEWTDKKTNSLLYFGWLITAPFCGLMPWRSHIWITAPKGGGKSKTVCQIATCSMVDGSYLYANADTTEAGIRQSINQDAIAAIIDEAEPNDEKDRFRLNKITAYFRNASSNDEAVALKGTATGEAFNFQVKSTAMMLSINHYLHNEADISRFALLNINLVPTTSRTMDNFNAIDDWCHKARLSNFGGKLVNATANKIGMMLDNIRIAARTISKETGSSRVGNQYGTLVGAALTHILNRELTEQDILNTLSEIDIDSTIASDNDKNDNGWSNCWATIASQNLEFQYSKDSITIGEAIDWLVNENRQEVISFSKGIKSNHSDDNNSLDNFHIENGLKMINQALAKYGIRYQHNSDDGKDKKYYVPNSEKGIYISRNNITLKKKLHGTAYVMWNEYAKRASIGCTPVMVKIASGQTQRAEFIPSEQLGV